MADKPISEQMIEAIRKRTERINSHPFCVIKFVVQQGRLDGMRFEEYEKFPKTDQMADEKGQS